MVFVISLKGQIIISNYSKSVFRQEKETIVSATIDTIQIKKPAAIKDTLASFKKERNILENTYLSEIPSIYPLKKNRKISSKFQLRTHPITGKKKFHNGIDLPATKGSPIYATADGVVMDLFTNKKLGIGYGVQLSHEYNYNTLYGHMLYPSTLSLGDSIKRGEIIGYVGNTGLSTGYHLHYTIYYKKRPINPIRYCKLLEGI